MSNKFKDRSIKNYTHYTNFDPNNIKIDEKSYKKILIYYTGYVTIEGSKYVKINSN